MTFEIMGFHTNRAAWYTVETFDWENFTLKLLSYKDTQSAIPETINLTKKSKWEFDAKHYDELMKSVIDQIEDYLKTYGVVYTVGE